jgi:hypothetical protein
LKAAATDAFKKACSFLGIGLHLYQDSAQKPAPSSGQSPGNGHANGNGRLTSRQLEAILAIGRDKGLDRDQVRQMALDRFGKNVEFIGKAESSSFIQELSAR